MGLDQYAFVRNPKAKSKRGHEIYYWRKHNRLHGWMGSLWKEKGCPNPNKELDGIAKEFSDFNCVELVLTLDDINALEKAIRNRKLPETHGFFFGSDSYGNEYLEKRDLKFIEIAKRFIKKGYEVFYDSWW